MSYGHAVVLLLAALLASVLFSRLQSLPYARTSFAGTYRSGHHVAGRVLVAVLALFVVWGFYHTFVAAPTGDEWGSVYDIAAFPFAVLLGPLVLVAAVGEIRYRSIEISDEVIPAGRFVVAARKFFSVLRGRRAPGEGVVSVVSGVATAAFVVFALVMLF